MKKTVDLFRLFKGVFLLLIFLTLSIAGQSQTKTGLLGHFQKGINLGGWISQYQMWSKVSFDTFITEKDINLISSWGMDHVRLPVDCEIIEEELAPFKMKEDGLRYIDDCLRWCKGHNLALIIDLHRAPGYSFENSLIGADKSKNQLWTNTSLQERYINIWKSMAMRYRDTKSNLIFELLNEVVGVDPSVWNSLAGKTVEAIRKIDPERIIMIGGTNYNSVFALKDIAVINDPKIVYTFHFYDPVIFTHQKAPWVSAAVDYNKTLEYPGTFPDFDNFLKTHPEYEVNLGRYLGHKLDKETMRMDLQPAVDFMKNTGKELYCGEFGIYNKTSLQSRKAWFSDLISFLDEYKIGHAVWSYKDSGFGFASLSAYEAIDKDLVTIVSH
jgi:endoglucanase